MPIHRSLLLAAAAAAALAAVPARADVAADTDSVDHLIAAYHQAVADHDGARLTALFVPTGSAWFSVLTDEGLKRVRATRPDTPRLRPGSVAEFARMVSTMKAPLDPQHSDLRIRSDGAIATVTFDFRFMIAGKEQNRGAESWQLVRSDDGWRIASIVFSATPPAPPPPAR